MSTPVIPAALPQFSGLDAGTWLNKVKAAAVVNSWGEKEILTYIPLLLSDSHAPWYFSLSETTKKNWKILQAAFTSRFVTKQGFRHVYLEQFNSRKLMPGESIDEYVHSLRKLAKSLDKTDADILESFVVGWPDNIRLHVIQKDPESVEAAVQQARLLLAFNTSQCVIPQMLMIN